MRALRAGLARLRCLVVAALLAQPLAAQEAGPGGYVTGTLQSPILTVDTERLFGDSAFGRQTLEEIERLGAELAAENRRIEADLVEEERRLTERRAEMDPAAFRAEADAFDARVMRIRREQEAKARAIAQQGDEARRRFLSAAQPVLQRIMTEAGAAVIVEQRGVFMSLEVIDITGIAIERLDAALAAGEEPPEVPPAPEAPDATPDAATDR